MATLAYSQTAPQPASSGPIDNHDVEDWKQRFNTVLAKPSEHVKSASPATAQSWHNSLFGCCSPIDLCLVTYCLPCITFGKTHHRLRKHGKMEGYEPINTSVSLPRVVTRDAQAISQKPNIVSSLLRGGLRRPALDPHVHAAHQHT